MIFWSNRPKRPFLLRLISHGVRPLKALFNPGSVPPKTPKNDPLDDLTPCDSEIYEKSQKSEKPSKTIVDVPKTPKNEC